MDDDRRCTAIRPTGERCGAWAMRDGSTLCAGHAGKGLASDPSTYSARGRASQRAQSAHRKEQAAKAKMTLRERLVHEAAERQDELVRALFAPLAASDDLEAHRAAVTILERMLGRPGEGIADLEAGAQPPSLEELVAALDKLTGLDEPGIPAVPQDAPALHASAVEG